MPLIRCLSVVQGEEVAFGEAVEEIVQVFLVVFELFEASCGLLRERWAFWEVREELFATPGSGVKVFEEGALAARGRWREISCRMASCVRLRRRASCSLSCSSCSRSRW